MAPFATLETRWFFDGDSGSYPALRRWIETCAPFPGSDEVGAPRWTGRAGGVPDVYLLMPRCRDMGIKWREGSLQIKGRVEDHGMRVLGPRHRGRVQRWIKWSYEEVPAAYRSLFSPGARDGLRTAAVGKTRALRMISLDGESPREVLPGAVLRRAVGCEMTDLELDGQHYCSIAFEAFPDDAVTAASFDSVVAGFLHELEHPLDADASMSYPEWLSTR